VKIEVEAKVRVTDHHDLVERLEGLAAKLVARMLETNIFVDSPRKHLHTSDRGLRVRQTVYEDDQPDRITVTFKGPRQPGQVKSRREVEFDVSDAQAAIDMFAELGMHEVIRFEKRRRRYVLDDCTIELDEMPHLGCFAEIEGPDDKTVLAMREQLGLGNQPLIKSSYVAMLINHLEDHGIPLGDVKFDSVKRPRRTGRGQSESTVGDNSAS
jgi:predicted adenylyl cyclase CyaB